MTTRRRVIAAGCILVAGLAATACGSEDINLKSGASPQVTRGATLFATHCSGCHTLDAAGTQGGATRIHDRERTDGPNFNVRPETTDSVLYAIRNGGFSGAIMPENIVVGQDAQAVAAFVSRYAGSKRAPTISPPSQPVAGAGGQGGGGGSGAPSTGTTSTPAQQGTTSTPAQQGTASTPEAGTTSTGGGTQQAAAQGKQIFTQNCGSCHTLKDANTNGQVGPNLDDLKPDQPTVQRQVTNGGGAMPAFKGQLSGPQIQAVAKYVSSVAGK
jgi:mono/diheme cytochrome c family protein